MKKLLPVLLLCAAAGAWWIWHKKTEPPRVPFAKAKREALVSTLPTNGKVEPIVWQTVRAESEGLVEKVPVQEGQVIAKGARGGTVEPGRTWRQPDGRGGPRRPGAGRSGHARSGREIGGAGRNRQQPRQSAPGPGGRHPRVTTRSSAWWKSRPRPSMTSSRRKADSERPTCRSKVCSAVVLRWSGRAIRR